MSIRFRFHVCLAAGLLALAVGSVSHAAAQEPAAAPPPAPATDGYDAAVDLGVKEFSAGNWEEACVHFDHAYGLRPGPRPLRGTGMCLYEQKRYAESVDALERALSMDDAEYPLTDEMRTSAEQLLATARKYVAMLKLEVTPADAFVQVDGRPAKPHGGHIYLNSGEHEVVVSHGERREARTLTVRLGEELTVGFDLTTEAPTTEAPAAAVVVEPEPRQVGVAPIVAFAVGGAGILTFGIFGAMALSEHGRLEDACGTTCRDSQVSTLEGYNVIADVGLGVGIIGTIVGVWLWQAGADEGATDGGGTAVLPWVGPGQLGVTARGSL